MDSSPQVEQALQQLASFSFCGLDPANVWIVVQRRRLGYRHASSGEGFSQASHATKLFVPANDGSLRGIGSGHAMMQLTWNGEAMAMDNQGVLLPLSHTVVDGLEEKGVK